MANKPTSAQRKKWDKIAELGCIVDLLGMRCCAPAEIHHANTGGGNRKNHDLVLPLCYVHHRGNRGIHTIGRKIWRELYGTEDELIEKVQKLLKW